MSFEYRKQYEPCNVYFSVPLLILFSNLSVLPLYGLFLIELKALCANSICTDYCFPQFLKFAAELFRDEACGNVKYPPSSLKCLQVVEIWIFSMLKYVPGALFRNEHPG